MGCTRFATGQKACARAFGFMCVLGVTALVVSGCGTLFGRTGGKPTVSRPAPSATVRISGSGTALPLLRILARDFNRVRPTIRIVFLPGVHSAGGIKGTAGGSLDVGSVSRELKPDEKRLGLSAYWLSDDALAVATHTSVPISGVTSSQLRSIYAGKIGNWKQLGGPDLEIAVLDRNEDESAKIVFRKYVLGSKLRIMPQAANLYYERDMVDGLLSTRGSIGYFSYGFAESEYVKVNILSLDGVRPSIEHVNDGSYRMTRILGIVVSTRKASPAARQFARYATSRRAADYMGRFGFAPHRQQR